MRSIYYLFTVLSLLTVIAATDRNHKKRQIYREQVLPHAGGRIPDTAFETDRLFLNRLQTEGIAVPDGVVPERRKPEVYHHREKSPRTVYNIVLSSDARYTPSIGRYHHQQVPSVETTYLYPQIHGQPVTFMPAAPAYPVYKQFELHNPQLNQVKLQAKKKPQTSNNIASGTKSRLKPFKSESYQNFNIINTPLRLTGNGRSGSAAKHAATRAGYNKQYLPGYDSSSSTAQLFNDFDKLFNNFDLHDSRNHFYTGNYPTTA